jgi:hypothetical protein
MDWLKVFMLPDSGAPAGGAPAPAAIIDAAAAVDLSAVESDINDIMGWEAGEPAEATPTVVDEPPAEEPIEDVPPTEEPPAEVPAVETPPKEEEPATPPPATPAQTVVADPAADIVKAENDFWAADAEMKKAEADLAAVQDEITALAEKDDTDLVPAGIQARQIKAERAINAAKAKMAKANELHSDARGRQQSFAEQQNSRFWADWSAKSKVPAAEGQKLFDAEYSALSTMYPGKDVTIAALERVNAKAKAAPDKPAAPTPAKKPTVVRPISKGGAAVPPAPSREPGAPMTARERFAAGEYDLSDDMRRMGISDD